MEATQPQPRKTKKIVKVLLVIAGILCLALIGVAIYFYTIGEFSGEQKSDTKTCGCYFVDPAIIDSCNPSKAVIYKTATTTDLENCPAVCSSQDLSVYQFNTDTDIDLFESCNVKILTDARCNSMIIKNQDDEVVTGRISSSDTITVTAQFDNQYTSPKFKINNEDIEADSVSGVKIVKEITDFEGLSSVEIVATATDEKGEIINSPVCRRIIDIVQEGESNVGSVVIQTSQEDTSTKISEVLVNVGNLPEDTSNISLKFAFDGSFPDLLMTDGFDVDTTRGRITAFVENLYNEENFSGDSFSILDNGQGDIEVTVSVLNETSSLGSAKTEITLVTDEQTDTDTDTDTDTVTESNFSVSKISNNSCVERVSPYNTATFTVTIQNSNTATDFIETVTDKLPLGFTYVEGSTRINGTGVADNEYLKVTTVGETQELVWEDTSPWSVASNGSLTIQYTALAGESALTGENQNEVVVTPVQIPSDTNSLRTELVITVAQDCDEDVEVTDDTPTTNPQTGIFDTTLGRLGVGLVLIVLGWVVYRRPEGLKLAEKMLGTSAYQSLEMTTFKIFNPKRYFEEKILRKRKSKDY